MVRLLNDAPEVIVLKILEVLANITALETSKFDRTPSLSKSSSKNLLFQQVLSKEGERSIEDDERSHPMTDTNANFALGLLSVPERDTLSRNREVFAALIHTHSLNPSLLSGLSTIIRKMCTIQPPEFVYVSFALELNIFVSKLLSHKDKTLNDGYDSKKARREEMRVAKYLHFVSKFVQVLANCFLTAHETERCRDCLKNCIANNENSTTGERKVQLFHILLNTFAHDCVAALSLCLWCGAYHTASSFLHLIDPFDLDIFFYLELDHLIELIESRPLFRYLHLKMLESDEDPSQEGSSAMLYRLLKSILMILPQSTSYNILQKRLSSVARFRQCAVHLEGMSTIGIKHTMTEVFVHWILEVRKVHCDAKWRSIRSESLEPASVLNYDDVDIDVGRRSWLGYSNGEEEEKTRQMYKNDAKFRSHTESNHSNQYEAFPENDNATETQEQNKDEGTTDEELQWKQYWEEST